MNASEQIDNYIADKQDWRGGLIAKLRQLILETVPDIQEEGGPPSAVSGQICMGE